MTAKEATIGFLKAIIQALEESDEEDQKPTAIILLKVKDDNQKIYWQLFFPDGLEKEDVQEAVKDAFQHHPYKVKGPTKH